MNFYFDAAGILDRLDAKQGSIKGVIGSLPENSRKRTAALIIETLKYKVVLSDVIQASGLLKQEGQKITTANLALLLVHDLLLSRGIQAGDGPVKQAILRHKTRLHAEFQKIKIKRGVRCVTELVQAGDPRANGIPRYVRVNLNEWTTEKAIQHFVERGFILSGDPITSKNSFSTDEHIPDLLLFHPLTQFHEDVSYKAGKIILQDKASCFSATVLAPPISDRTVVIDATAAPGNKTSHLSALMHNRGRIYAFEKDRKRFSTLRHMLNTAKCSNVEPLNADFLTVNPLDPQYADVTHILLDPSCSGSGIVNRLDHLLDTEDENEEVLDARLNKLAAFQLMMIKHAMKFPAVIKIVYSTCSIHATENEDVVYKALSSDEANASKFTLAPRADVLPTWHRRGLQDNMKDIGNADALIRCAPGEDHTNGFFVSCFLRKDISAPADRIGQVLHAEPLGKKRSAEDIQEGEKVADGEQEGNTQRKRKKKRKRVKS